ncbi:MAG: PCRF domain-containing protein, partial [Clostridia bacterium]|nr:PCRF domain-containing protein [Clostridia bacterium]
MAGKGKEIADLEEKTFESGFWDDRENAQKVLQRITGLKERVKRYYELEAKLEDIRTLWELGQEENDESVETEISTLLSDFIKALDSLELELLLSGRYDSHNAILALHAG